MISYTKGNLLDSSAQALVNTVNTVGVMGKGIALQFREAFPENFRQYKKACTAHELHPGKLLVVKELTPSGEKYIINFPTKVHWRQPSRYEYIEKGLQALVKAIEDYRLESVAIPPLGCGNGGLEWNRVKALMEESLQNVDAVITIYEPNAAVKALLQKQNKRKPTKLTPARAMLLYALFQYEAAGGDYSSVFAANKLAYFLQRMGEQLRLQFVPYHYGPYSVQVEHVLYDMNGVYLQGLEQKKAKPFEPLQMNYDKYKEVEHFVHTQLQPEQALRLENLLTFLEGFESALSLELLSSVDFILQQEPTLAQEEVIQRISQWSNRKEKMLRPEYIKIAYKHLKDYQNTPLNVLAGR